MSRARIRDDLTEGMNRSRAEERICLGISFLGEVGVKYAGDEDERIARLYLICKIPQADIAEEIGYERSTISRRMKRIIRKMRIIT